MKATVVKELHTRSRELLIAINEFYKDLPEWDEKNEDIKAIDLNADQIQCIAEDIRYWAHHGKKMEGSIEPQ